MRLPDDHLDQPCLASQREALLGKCIIFAAQGNEAD